MPGESTDHDGPPRTVLIAAIVVAVAAVIGILVFAALPHDATRAASPVAIAVCPRRGRHRRMPGAARRCARQHSGDYRRAAVADPAPAGAAAWRPCRWTSLSSCGAGWTGRRDFIVGRPGPGRRRCRVVSKLPITGRSTWFAVDRPVYVALTLPHGSGPTPIQAISEAVAKSLPAVAGRPGSGALTQARCRGLQAPSRPWSPTTSDSPRRWPPTSVDTSRSS